MKNIVSSSIFRIVYGVLYAVSLLPLGVLYVLSDCACPLLYYVIRYRRRVVRRNLEQSFPEMTHAGIVRTERKFYRWLCDYFVETVKLMSVSAEEIKRRMTFKGTELIDEATRRGQSSALFLGHYCNWEWVSTLPLHIDIGDCLAGELYHPLRNVVMDKVFLRLRQRFHTVCINKNEALRTIVRCRRSGMPVVIGYISDQKPKWQNIHLWVDFLNHKDTPVFTGTEKIVKMTDQVFFYADMRRPRRGSYECEFRMIERRTAGIPDFELTERYMRELEKSIRREPAYYLWTHDRWSRTRDEFDRRFYVRDGKVYERKYAKNNE